MTCLCNHDEAQHLLTSEGRGDCCYCPCDRFEEDPIGRDPFPAVVDCAWCNGTGKLTTDETCRDCHGTGVVLVNEEVAP